MINRRYLLAAMVSTIFAKRAHAILPWIIRTLVVGYSAHAARSVATRAVVGAAGRRAIRKTAGRAVVVGGIAAPSVANAAGLPTPTRILTDRALKDFFGGLYDRFAGETPINETIPIVSFDSRGRIVRQYSSFEGAFDAEIGYDTYTASNSIECFAHNLTTKESYKLEVWTYTAKKLGTGHLRRRLTIRHDLPSGPTIIVYMVRGNVIGQSKPFVVG